MVETRWAPERSFGTLRWTPHLEANTEDLVSPLCFGSPEPKGKQFSAYNQGVFPNEGQAWNHLSQKRQVGKECKGHFVWCSIPASSLLTVPLFSDDFDM